jgi:glutamyl-tRNA(Gln) amidotransferase subunit E
MKGVPNETRQVLANGETRFERVLPGPERMYPDTDLPPLAIPDERLARIRSGTLPPVWEREEWLAEIGVPAHELVPLAISRRYRAFTQLVREQGVAPRDASRVLVSMMKALAREGRDVNAIPDTEISALFALFAQRAFAREAFAAILRAMAGGASAAEAVRQVAGEPVAEAAVRARAKEVVHGAPAIADAGRRTRYLMGLAMKGLRGRVPGREMLAAIEREVQR